MDSPGEPENWSGHEIMKKIESFSFLALSAFVMLASACQRKAKEPESVEIPQADTPHAPGEAKKAPPDDVRVPKLPENTQVKALAPGEEVTCPSLCSHLAFCNRRVHQKETSAAALSACVGGCSSRRGESDRRRWEAMENCVRQHPGEDCAALRACMDKAMMDIQKELHGKTPDTEKQP